MTGESIPRADDPWLGQTLAGKYRLDERLGEGGFGTAYLAADLNYAKLMGGERHVVVKLPRLDRLGDGRGVPKDFRKEAHALTTLEHAHIVKVLDVGTQTVTHLGQEREIPFLVLQYASGKSLEDRLLAQGGIQSLEEVLGWLPDVARALDYLHAQVPPVLHRDVKPGNILFDAAGSALLADFGIAKIFGAGSVTGGLPGSPLYMAPDPMLVPERADGGSEVLDGRYDQYALAVTVYEALSGHLPHEPTSWANGRRSSVDEHAGSRLVYRKTTEPPAPLRSFAAHISPAVASAIERALSTIRERRFGSCRAFATAVAAAAVVGDPSRGHAASSGAPSAMSDRSASASGIGAHGEGARRDHDERPPGSKSASGGARAPQAFDLNVGTHASTKSRRVVVSLVAVAVVAGGLYAARDAIFGAAFRAGSGSSLPAEARGPAKPSPYTSMIAEAKAAASRGDLRSAKARVSEARAVGAGELDIPAELQAALEAYDVPPSLRWDEPMDGTTTSATSIHVRGELLRGRSTDIVSVSGSKARTGPGPFDVAVPLDVEGERRIAIDVLDEVGRTRLPAPIERRVTYRAPWRAPLADAAAAAASEDWQGVEKALGLARAAGAGDADVPRTILDGIARYNLPPTLAIESPVEGAEVSAPDVVVEGSFFSTRPSDLVLVDGRAATVEAGRFHAVAHVSAEGEHTIEVGVFSGKRPRLEKPVVRTIRYHLPWRAPLQRAQAAADSGELKRAKTELADARAKGLPEAEIPADLSAALRRFDTRPTLSVTSPTEGGVVYAAAAEVRGRVVSARETDDVYVNGILAIRDGQEFRATLPRAKALNGRLDFVVRDGEEERATGTKKIRWSDGTTCPDFSLTDIDGRVVSRDRLAGKWIVLEWVNFNCHFTRHAYDTSLMQPVQAALTGQGVVWVLVCATPPTGKGYMNASQWRSELARRNIEGVSVVPDAAQTLELKFDVISNCHAVIIDPSGRIAYSGATTNEDEFVNFNATTGVMTSYDSPPASRINFIKQAFEEAIVGRSISDRGKGRSSYG